MIFFQRTAIFPRALGGLVMVVWSGLVSAQSPTSEADSLYANRADLASAKKAVELWQAALSREPGNFEAAWKLARACYWLGGHGRESERRAFLEQGINAARSASQMRPGRPEGHFWTAANMGALAESGGMSAGLKYRKPIKAALETVLRIDPAFQQGSADRALGRWYFKVPGLFGGSKKQAEAHLRASLKYNEESTATHFFLAELFLDQDRKEQARQELTKVLEAPLDPNWTPEDHDFKSKAKVMLARLND